MPLKNLRVQVGQFFKRPKEAVTDLVEKVRQNRIASIQKRDASNVRADQFRTNVSSAVTNLAQKVQSPKFNIPRITLPQVKEGVQRVKQTPLKEFFLPTATDTKKLIGPALATLSPIETGIAAAIRKEPKSFKVKLREEFQRGGDIPGALKTRGVPGPIAFPLGIGLAVALPGAGEVGALKGVKGLKGVDKTTLDPVQKIIGAIKGAKPIRRVQEKLYTAERGARFAKAEQAGLKVGGEKGFFAELGQLKGELPKAEFESLRKNIKQPDVDFLYDKIRKHPTLMYGEKLTAQEGLSKLLGIHGAGVPTKSELRLLEQVYGGEFTQAVLEKRSAFTKLWEGAGQILSVPRSLMAGVLDMSFGLRQGVFNAYRYPKQWGSAFKSQFKWFANEDAFQALNKEIQARPNYNLMKENKLALMDLGATVTQREEQFQSQLAEKIPVIGKFVRASSRAYTGFANKLRADVFDDFIKLGERTGAIENPNFLKDAANFVNTSTGRGSWGEMEKSMGALSTTFFSPRLLKSRLDLLNPVYYARLDPVVRKRALEGALAFLAGSATVLSLAEMGGAKVGKDPTSSDFGKIKIGNTRIDLFGGFQQPIVLLARLYTGRVTSSVTGEEMFLGEGYRPLTRFDMVLRYFESKEAPIVSFLTSLLKGETAIGEPFVASTETLKRVTPVFIQDLVDLYKEGGEEKAFPLGFIGAAGAFFGAGVQTYGANEKQQRRISAKELYTQLPKLPPEERSRLLQETIGKDPHVIDELKKYADEQERDLSREDRIMLDKPINSTYSPKMWDRANHIVKTLEKMSDEEKSQYIGELVRKKIITDEVSKQINILLIQKANEKKTTDKQSLKVETPKLAISNPFKVKEALAAEPEQVSPRVTVSGPTLGEMLKEGAKYLGARAFKAFNDLRVKEVKAPDVDEVKALEIPEVKKEVESTKPRVDVFTTDDRAVDRELGRNPEFKKVKPRPAVKEAIQKAARKFQVPASLLFDIALQESSLDPEKVNEDAGDIHPTGLFQFTDATWDEVLKYANDPNSSLHGVLPTRNRKDPETNALAAAYLIRFGQLGKWDASEDVWGEFWPTEELDDRGFYAQSKYHQPGMRPSERLSY